MFALMRTGLAIVALALALVLSQAGNAAAAPIPSDFFGVSSPDLIGQSSDARAAILADQRAAGVRLLRQLFDWHEIEADQGQYDWAALDSFMASAASSGMKVLPVVLYSPQWASSCPGDTDFDRCPPADPADLGNFVVTAIHRYGPNGSFWANNPTVPKDPITAWQLWNEPAIRSYWPSGPDPAEYVDLLKGAVPLIREADPKAEIVGAGIPDSTSTGAVPMADYVSGMYAAGLKGLVDDVAIHLYDDDPAGAIQLVEQTRATMNANGDSATPIWATEFGWASAGKPNRFVTDLAGQAANLQSLISQLVARHEELGIRGVAEYDWHDASAQSNTTDVWELHLGLVDVNYAHKPAYGAFQSVAVDTTPPDTAIVSAPSGTVAPGPLTVSFSSTQPGSDFQCNLDGAGWGACASPLDLGSLSLGSHALSVRATDPYGNTDPIPAAALWLVAQPGSGVKPAIKAPVLRLNGLAKQLRRLSPRKRQLKVSVLWPAAGRITLTLRAHGIQLARGTRLVRHRGRATLVLKVSSRGRRLLVRSGRLPVVLREQFKPLSGPGASARAKFVLRPR
jgi:hypothetical protein